MMKDIKRIVMDLCGHKIAWNDCVLPGVRIVKILKGFLLMEYEKEVIKKWVESDSKTVLFVGGNFGNLKFFRRSRSEIFRGR